MKFEHNTDIGQNFLRDGAVAEWMASRASVAGRDVLEIGPGDGVLTRALLAAGCRSLCAVELDVRLEPFLAPLARDERLTIVWRDAMKFDFAALDPPPSHIVANLPYNITTPVIWRSLEHLSGKGLETMLLMTQREAAVRITSGAGSRESCPLGITLAAIGSAVSARRVGRGSFVPVPRVDSAIIEIKLSGEMSDLPRDARWRRLLAGSFAQRRKTLVNNWTSSFRATRAECERVLESLGLRATLRPEEASLDDWLALRRCEDLPVR